MGRGITIGSLFNTPRLDTMEAADATSDRALSESGRYALDMMDAPPYLLPVPTLADVADLARKAAKLPRKVGEALRLPAPCFGGSMLPC